MNSNPLPLWQQSIYYYSHKKMLAGENINMGDIPYLPHPLLSYWMNVLLLTYPHLAASQIRPLLDERTDQYIQVYIHCDIRVNIICISVLVFICKTIWTLYCRKQNIFSLLHLTSFASMQKIILFFSEFFNFKKYNKKMYFNG